METLELESCVRGYHIYKEIWSPTAGQEFQCEREELNAEDPYAVAVICGDSAVGHESQLPVHYFC